jgi:hypothetical protein
MPLQLSYTRSNLCVDLMRLKKNGISSWASPRLIIWGRLKWKGTFRTSTSHVGLFSVQCHHVWSHKPLFKTRSKVRSLNIKGYTTKKLRGEDGWLFDPMKMLYRNIILKWMRESTTWFPICVRRGRATIYKGSSFCPFITILNRERTLRHRMWRVTVAQIPLGKLRPIIQ